MSAPRRKVDLHAHSTASDGALTPAALVQRAAAEGVELFALTDHDTVAGLDEARAAAAEAGIGFMPGIEISVSWQRRTLHIVGLGVDSHDPALLAGLSMLAERRQTRAETMAGRLERIGVDNALARVRALAGDAGITRTHLARLLVETGLSPDMKQAFRRWLGAGKPAYASAEWASLEDAVSWIRSAGGVPVLAHPMRYRMSAAWRERMLKAFGEAGGLAIEVCCGGGNEAELRTIAREARAHGLMGSAGSDFHEPAQRWLRLGALPPMPEGIEAVWTRWTGDGWRMHA